MDGKLALLYLIIFTVLTFFYSNSENPVRLREALSSLTVAQVQADEE